MKYRITCIILFSFMILSLFLLGCKTTETNQLSLSAPDKIPGHIEEENKYATVFDKIPEATEWQKQDYKKSRKITFNEYNGSMMTLKSLSKDQQEIISLEGFPDYHRQFKNFKNQKIDEWLYESKDYQIQFKEGELVYFGPIDDKAKIGLLYGQPNKILQREFMGDNYRETFWYKKDFRVISFSNGKKIADQ